MEGKQLEGHYLGAEDYTIHDYIANITEILADCLKNNNYLGYSLQEIGKLIRDLNGYIGVVKKKADLMKDDLENVKSTLENKKDQETFMQEK